MPNILILLCTVFMSALQERFASLNPWAEVNEVHTPSVPYRVCPLGALIGHQLDNIADDGASTLTAVSPRTLVRSLPVRAIGLSSLSAMVVLCYINVFCYTNDSTLSDEEPH